MEGLGLFPAITAVAWSGDEPEPPELVLWPLSRLDELLESDQFNEARAIAALTLCKSRLVAANKI